MSIRAAAVTFGAIAIGACSLYGGLDGLSSSGDPGNVPDAASTETGGGPTEDGASNDASTDAGADAIPANDAGPDARYCAAFTADELCADFDDSSAGGSPVGWSKSVTATSDVAVAASGALSAPNALRATTGASGSNRYAYFTRSVGAASVDRARLSYALYVEQRPQGTEIEVNGLVFAATKNYEFYLAVLPNENAYIVEQSAEDTGAGLQTTYHDIGTAIPSGQWLRVVLEVTLAGTTKELVLSVDGVERARKPLTLTGPGVPRVRTGITWADTLAANGVILVDDVRFDVLP